MLVYIKKIDLEAIYRRRLKINQTMTPNQYQSDFEQAYPRYISYFSRKQAGEILNISESHLRRDCSMLNEISDQLPGWSHLPGARGFDRQTLYILWLFRKLCRELGRGKGLDILIQELNQSN